MSKITIATIVPNDYFAPWDYVRSIFKLKGYDFLTVQGCSLHHNRNGIWQIMKQGGDLLFIDSDMTFEPEDVAKIEKHLNTYDIIGGLYMLANGEHAIFKRIEGDYEFIQPKQGIFEVGAIGTGFLGISSRVIQKLGKEPFNAVQEGSVTHGDDVSFCHRAREAGFKVWCDPSIVLGHIKSQVIKPGDTI